VQAVGGHGQRLDLAVEDRRERGVDRPGGGVEAKMLLRAITVVGAAALATWVNWPPATSLSPTWTMAATLPSSTCGVQSAGLLDTTTACGTLTAAPGCAIRPTRTAADSNANRTRRPMWSDSPL
jgi:hypothetical protein